MNGKADAVLLDAKTFEKHLKASNMARLLVPAEEDITSKRTRPIRSFLRELKVPARFRVRITQKAETDIEEIWTYIAEDSWEAATEFVHELDRQVQSLESFPERCPLIPENELLGTGYRHLLYGNYRTIFRVTNLLRSSSPLV